MCLGSSISPAFLFKLLRPDGMVVEDMGMGRGRVK